MFPTAVYGNHQHYHQSPRCRSPTKCETLRDNKSLLKTDASTRESVVEKSFEWHIRRQPPSVVKSVDTTNNSSWRTSWYRDIKQDIIRFTWLLKSKSRLSSEQLLEITWRVPFYVFSFFFSLVPSSSSPPFSSAWSSTGEGNRRRDHRWRHRHGDEEHQVERIRVSYCNDCDCLIHDDLTLLTTPDIDPSIPRSVPVGEMNQRKTRKRTRYAVSSQKHYLIHWWWLSFRLEICQ